MWGWPNDDDCLGDNARPKLGRHRQASDGLPSHEGIANAVGAWPQENDGEGVRQGQPGAAPGRQMTNFRLVGGYGRWSS